MPEVSGSVHADQVTVGNDHCLGACQRAAINVNWLDDVYIVAHLVLMLAVECYISDL